MALYIGKLLEFFSDLLIQAFFSRWHTFHSGEFSSPDNRRTHRPIKRRRSIVRLIGTYLPLPSAPRVYLNLAAWNSCPNSYTSTVYVKAQCSEEELSNGITSQTDGCDTVAAIKSLQEELQELRLQIAAILENQSNVVKEVVKDIDVQTDSEEDTRLLNLSVPPPPPPIPPPPPPPPPLPPAAVNSPNIKIVKKKDSKYYSYPRMVSTPSALHILGQVVSEMKNGRPKLRPVQRSPGGGPLKTPKLQKTDPADVLTEVLRRRFSVAQMSSDTNESDSSASVTDVPSPDWNLSTS